MYLYVFVLSRISVCAMSRETRKRKISREWIARDCNSQ